MKVVDPQAEFEQFKADLRKQLLDYEDHGIEETHRSLDFLIRGLRTAQRDIEKGENPSELLIALRNLARYAGWLLLIFKEGLGRPIEFYGWLSRALFELYVLTLFVLRSEENLQVFLKAAMTDEIMILEGLRQLEGYASVEAGEEIRAEIDRLKAERGDERSQLPTYAAIATAVGVKEEYDAFWRLYSKYVHPSSWMINGKPDRVRNVSYERIFQLQAQFNAHRVLQLVASSSAPAA